MLKLKIVLPNNLFEAQINEYALSMESLSDDLTIPFMDGIGNEGVIDNIKEKIKSLIKWFKEKLKNIINKIKDSLAKYRYLTLGYRGHNVMDSLVAFKEEMVKYYKESGNIELSERIKKSDHKAYLQYVYQVLQRILDQHGALQEFKMFGRVIDILDDGFDAVSNAWWSLNRGQLDGYNVERLANAEKLIEEYERIVRDVPHGPIKNIHMQSAIHEFANFSMKVDIFGKPSTGIIERAITRGEEIYNQVTSILEKQTDSMDSTRLANCNRVLHLILRFNTMSAAVFKIVNIIKLFLCSHIGLQKEYFLHSSKQYIKFMDESVKNETPVNNDDNKPVGNLKQLGYKSK